MDRIAKIAERLVRRRARSNFRSADAFVRYLRSTLIPDLKVAGMRETAKDFETVVQLIKSGKVDKGFVGYLLDTLIPDLLDSGSNATADDFEEGVYWIHSKEGALSRLSTDKVAAMGGSIFTHSKGIEFLYNPVTSFMQIGMGGEWWSGTIKADRNVFRHRKESVDPAYKPVTVYVRDLGHNVAFDVAGGFGYGETFIVGARPA